MFHHPVISGPALTVRSHPSSVREVSSVLYVITLALPCLLFPLTLFKVTVTYLHLCKSIIFEFPLEKANGGRKKYFLRGAAWQAGCYSNAEQGGGQTECPQGNPEGPGWPLDPLQLVATDTSSSLYVPSLGDWGDVWTTAVLLMIPTNTQDRLNAPLRPQNYDMFDVNCSDIVLTDLELHRDNEKTLQYRELDHGDAGSGLQSDAVSCIILEVSWLSVCRL